MKSKHLALGGIFTAISLIFLYLSTLISINKLFLLGLASCVIPLSIITTNIKNSLIVYTATSILTFILVPSKAISILYVLLFGIYGFVKYFIEKLRNTPIEILLKLLFFNTSLLLVYSLYNALFTEIIQIKFSVIILIMLLQAFFILYDYVLTAFVSYSNKNLVKKIK